MRSEDGPASSELASGEDIREAARFAAFLDRVDEVGMDAAYDEVFGGDDVRDD